jgi:hypothetical protein
MLQMTRVSHTSANIRRDSSPLNLFLRDVELVVFELGHQEVDQLHLVPRRQTSPRALDRHIDRSVAEHNVCGGLQSLCLFECRAELDARHNVELRQYAAVELGEQVVQQSTRALLTHLFAHTRGLGGTVWWGRGRGASD